MSLAKKRGTKASTPTVTTLMLSAGGKAIPTKCVDDGSHLTLGCRYFPPLIEELKALAGAKWLPGPKAWRVSNCERNRVQLALLQGVLPDALKRYELPLETVTPYREGTHCFCGGKRADCPGCAGTGVFHVMAQQTAMLAHGWTVRRGIWAAEMGVGKSLAAIELMEHAADEGFVDWWWIAPLSVLQAVKLELVKWGCKVKPKLIHFDVLRKELERWPKGQRAPHGIIIDEASRCKNGGTLRAKAVQHLADAVRGEHDGFVIEMSGTPAPKDPVDWHSLAEIACPGFLRESSAARLRARLEIVEQAQGAQGHMYPKHLGWREDEVALLKRRLDGLVQVHFARDCQDLPPLRRELVEIPVTPETMRAARLIVNTSLNGAGALNKLRQLSDGFQYQEDGSARRCDGPKDRGLIDLLDRHEEAGRVIVYASYHESVDRCVDLCIQEGWTVLRCDGRGWQAYEGQTVCASCGIPFRLENADEEPDCKAFLAGDTRCGGTTWKVVPAAVETDPAVYLRLLDRSTDDGSIQKLAYVAHPKSGSMGLTLTACPGSVYFSLDFDFESFAQSLARGQRTGMDVVRGFTAWFLCHLPTDKLVLKNLDEKKTLQAISLGDVKEALA